MKFFIGGELVTTKDFPLVVVLTDEDKKSIANMNPECNVFCQFEKEEHTVEEIESIVSKAKELNGLKEETIDDIDLTKQTITLGSEDNPVVSLMKGHVDAKTFVKATMKEGWDNDMTPQEVEDNAVNEAEMIEHCYGCSKLDENGKIKSWRYDLKKDDENAEPITIRLW